jgi:hypothetical protein
MADVFEEVAFTFANKKDWTLFVRILGNMVAPRAVFLGELDKAVRSAYAAKSKTEDDGSIRVEMTVHQGDKEQIEKAVEKFERLRESA